MEHQADIETWIAETKRHVEAEMSGEGTGHDWWHVERVWNNAKLIARGESVDMVVVELAALLHDIADYKFHDGDETIGPETARKWLQRLSVDSVTIDHVCEIIMHLSFKGAETRSLIRTREGMVVQDADRLDAIGAIGVARTFAYGGHKGREIYNPEIPPVLHQTSQDYKSGESPTVNHFYEKLLLLKDRMNTEAAKEIATERHEFMETFLSQFYREWNGEA